MANEFLFTVYDDEVDIDVHIKVDADQRKIVVNEGQPNELFVNFSDLTQDLVDQLVSLREDSEFGEGLWNQLLNQLMNMPQGNERLNLDDNASVAGSDVSDMTNDLDSSVDNSISQSKEDITAEDLAGSEAERFDTFDVSRREEERRTRTPRVSTPPLGTAQEEDENSTNDLYERVKENLGALSDSVRTRTKDASRMNPNIHPTVSQTQKTLSDIQNDMTAINKAVEALLKMPEAEKFWRMGGRYKVAFPLDQRKELLEQRMIIPGEEGADQSVELQHAPEYIKKRLKALETPMGKQTKEYKDLVAIQKEVKALIKVIKDPRTTGEKIYDALLTTCFAVVKLATGVIAIGVLAAAGGAAFGVAAGALGVAAGALGVAAGVVGAALAIAIVVGVIALLVKALQWSHQNIVSPAWQGLKNGFNSLSENQAKFRILSNILPYEPTEIEPNNNKLEKGEALKLATNMEQTLVLYEVFESSEPRKELGEHNTVDYAHLKTIIDLKHVAGVFSEEEVQKYINDREGYLTYEEEVIIPQFKEQIIHVLGEDKVKFHTSRTGRVSIAYLDESTKEALRNVAPKVWIRFNNELKGAQNELLSTIRAQFKTGDMLGRNKRHMTLGTYKDAVEVAQKASQAIHDLNPTTGERLSAAYSSSNLSNAKTKLVALNEELDYLERSPSELNNSEKQKLRDKINATERLVEKLVAEDAAKAKRQQAQAAAPSLFERIFQSEKSKLKGDLKKINDQLKTSFDSAEKRKLNMKLRTVMLALDAKGAWDDVYVDMEPNYLLVKGATDSDVKYVAVEGPTYKQAIELRNEMIDEAVEDLGELGEFTQGEDLAITAEREMLATALEDLRSNLAAIKQQKAKEDKKSAPDAVAEEQASGQDSDVEPKQTYVEWIKSGFGFTKWLAERREAHDKAERRASARFVGGDNGPLLDDDNVSLPSGMTNGSENQHEGKAWSDPKLSFPEGDNAPKHGVIGSIASSVGKAITSVFKHRYQEEVGPNADQPESSLEEQIEKQEGLVDKAQALVDNLDASSEEMSPQAEAARRDLQRAQQGLEVLQQRERDESSNQP